MIASPERAQLQQQQTTSWLKPPTGSLKLSIDAMLFKEFNKFGVGIFIRGDQGTFVSVKTLLLDGIPEPGEAKAIGLLHALIWAQELVYKISYLSLTDF
ncbi:hypothetical protein GmHk_13G037935 [Glycine max]|nr:hypothetical protein GmHk_13G037935 [Glycine max]